GTDHVWAYTYTVSPADFDDLMPENGAETISCVADLHEPTLPTVKDACGRVLSPIGAPEISEIPSCEGVVTYTYSYKDCANHINKWVYTYTINDNIDPVIADDVVATLEADVENCVFTVPDLIASVRAKSSDNCTSTANLAVSQSPAAGTVISESTTVVVTVKDCADNTVTTNVAVTVPQVITSSITSAESFCFNKADGVIKGTFEGGQAPYNVSWAIGDEVKGTQEGVSNINIENLPDGTYTVTVTDKNGCHVDQTAIISELKQKVVVTANSDEKTYDGTPLTNSGYTTSENLEPGDAFADVVVEGTRTDVGTSVNKVTSFKIMRGDQDVTCYYDTATVLGNLTINCRPLTITSATHEFTYDGNAHSDATYNVDGLADGESVEVTVEGTIQYVTESPVVNKITAYTFTVGKAENYCIDTTYGKLTMKFECQPITIKANDNSWKYDGESHSDDGYTLTIGEGDDAITETVGADGVYTFANGDVLTVDVAGSVTNVVEGTVANNAAIVSVLNGTVDVSGAYCATVTPGELTITKRNITFTSATDEKVYDGTELINHTVTVGGDNFVSGEGATFDVTGTRTLVGTSDNTFTYTFNEGTDANNYDVTKVEGTLTVTDNTTPIVITSSDKSFEYDCALHTDEVYNVTYGGAGVPVESDGKTFTLPTGDKLVITSTTSGVRYYDATYSENNTFEYTLEHNDQYKGDRDTTFGTLTITKRPIVITAYSKDKPYDGIALIDNGFTTNGNEAPCDEVASAVVTGSQTEVGTSDNTVVDAVIKDKTSGDVVTDNYEITYVKGELEVTSIEVNVTITKHGKKEIFDGETHTVSGYDFVSSNPELFKRDDLKFIGEVSDSIATGVEVGKYGMTFTKESFENLNKNFSAVNITIVEDSLEITPIAVDVTITKHGLTEAYDGETHSVSGYDFLSSNPELFKRDDLKFIGEVSDSIATGVEVGKYGMTFTKESFENLN
ncbi:MAG: hypothetical protein MJZ96_09170, partial [Paludibacteraceae bacterium]|nr:hypothetical protein [Paludibacteraceae bacterium]